MQEATLHVSGGATSAEVADGLEKTEWKREDKISHIIRWQISVLISFQMGKLAPSFPICPVSNSEIEHNFGQRPTFALEFLVLRRRQTTKPLGAVTPLGPTCTV